MDRDYADNEASTRAPRFEHALFVKSQVMSRSTAHAVVDAGHKSHAIDSGLPRVWQHELEYSNGGDEHGILRPNATATLAELPKLGDTVWLVPGHCDPTVNLHDHYIVVRGGLAQWHGRSGLADRQPRLPRLNHSGALHDRPADHRPGDAGVPAADRHRIPGRPARATTTPTA